MASISTSTQRSSSGTSTDHVEHWSVSAACLSVDTDLFYHSDGHTGFESKDRDAVAIRICDSCPVKKECAAFGIDQTVGVWGGVCKQCEHKSSKQRRKGDPILRAACGTLAGYEAHIDEHERICKRCIDGKTAAAKREQKTALERETLERIEERKRYRARKSTEAAVEVYASPHGTAEGRKNLGTLIESIKERS